VVGFTVVTLLQGKMAPVSTRQATGWAPEPLLMQWRREKSVSCARNQTLILLADFTTKETQQLKTG
jgi:hypothetical protein